MECYSALKRNELLIDFTTWIDVENTVLSETSQNKRTSITGIWNRSIHRESIIVVARDWIMGSYFLMGTKFQLMGNYCLKGTEFQFRRMKKLWR